MRNPNGFGGISYLGKGRRKPYRARVTAGYEEGADGIFRQKYKAIGYFKTKKEALQALIHYNELNTPAEYIDITFADVFQRWFEREQIQPNTPRYYSYKAAFNKCNPLWNLKMSAIRFSDLENILYSNGDLSKSGINNIRIVISGAYSWAMANDVVTKDYSELLKDINVGKKVTGHQRFTLDEVADLWHHSDEAYIPLVYIYTGCRASELLELPKSDVHLSEQYFEIKKAKTQSGVRTVPIADCILPFFERLMQAKGNTLIPMSYNKLQAEFKSVVPNHRCHDTRVTFVSMLTDVGTSDIVIKKIVGHRTGTVTGDVYTQLDLKTMLQAVNNMPFNF